MITLENTENTIWSVRAVTIPTMKMSDPMRFPMRWNERGRGECHYLNVCVVIEFPVWMRIEIVTTLPVPWFRAVMQTSYENQLNMKPCNLNFPMSKSKSNLDNENEHQLQRVNSDLEHDFPTFPPSRSAVSDLTLKSTPAGASRSCRIPT